jgi:two-component system LytT family response regulator
VNSAEVLRAYLVDDEPLALKRLARQLASCEGVVVCGSATDPIVALEFLLRDEVDVVFLDIQMPEMNGFELLSRLNPPPMVVFTTAYDQYALRAFQVNAIDYLLKPVDRLQLDRALQKLRRLQASLRSGPPLQDWMKREELQQWLLQLADSFRSAARTYPDRITSRTGDRVRLIDLRRVSHFYAADKLTYASVGGQSFSVDYTIAQLERDLDPARFFRIHRSVLVNLELIQEVHAWFAGRVRLRLADGKHTELTVARDRVRALKEHLSF